ncbi:hypothetical protein [Methyloprofundus sp.]|uniref:hypothetical protein n=1 Tax=Methyloprofundus sp. TaxID=2020875 RepID=UPI003D0986F0
MKKIRAHFTEFLKNVSYRGETIDNLVPETNAVQKAQNRLDKLRGTMIIGDIMEPLNIEFNSTAKPHVAEKGAQ